MPSVYPIVKIPAAHRGWYPHMGKRDQEVWERYLSRPHPDFVAFAYDVALGGNIPTAPLITEEESLGWQYSTALKIDACAWLLDRVWIIEIKPQATVSALGAAVAYQLVAQRERAFDVPSLPVILCEYCHPDVRWCSTQLGVEVIEVGA
jgi:hypothetical protein